MRHGQFLAQMAAFAYSTVPFASGAQAAVFDNAPVAMGLAVFSAGVEAQEHRLARSIARSERAREGRRSPLAGLGKGGAWRARSCVAREARKVKIASQPLNLGQNRRQCRWNLK